MSACITTTNLNEQILKIEEKTPIDITNDTKIVISPIAKTKKKYGPCSRTDWEEQMLLASHHAQMMWDDSPRNNSEIGDIFIACHNNIAVSIHLIEKILSPTERLPSWTKNVGQGDRNVIYISRELGSLSWNEWLECGGAKKVLGTTAVKKNKSHILNTLKNKKIIV
tara:strand:+ start:219 stop:719 length:501 start_codon:yes stop_codon:yes gene_type:complete